MEKLKEAITAIRVRERDDLIPVEIRDFVEHLTSQKFQEIEAFKESLLSDIASKINAIELQQGDKGEQGDMGKSGDLGEQGPKGDKGDLGAHGLSGKDGKPGKDGKSGKDGRNGLDGVDGKDGKNGKDGKDGSPDKPKDIAKKLNTLTEEVDISVIKGLSKSIENLRNYVREKGGSKQIHGGGNIVEYYDLSATLNGATKQFTIPINRKIVQVISSSAPFVFRPIIDYTNTRTRITFDPAIDASSMLASGQSLIILYTH